MPRNRPRPRRPSRLIESFRPGASRPRPSARRALRSVRDRRAGAHWHRWRQIPRKAPPRLAERVTRWCTPPTRVAQPPRAPSHPLGGQAASPTQRPHELSGLPSTWAQRVRHRPPLEEHGDLAVEGPRTRRDLGGVDSGARAAATTTRRSRDPVMAAGSGQHRECGNRVHPRHALRLELELVRALLLPVTPSRSPPKASGQLAIRGQPDARSGQSAGWPRSSVGRRTGVTCVAVERGSDAWLARGSSSHRLRPVRGWALAR
jgi:hypothetical protein